MRISLVLTPVLLAAALAHRPAAAQSDRDNVARQLAAVATQKQSDGYTDARVVDGATTIGLLPNRGSVMIELNLRAGVQYFIAAGCDRDCSDMDTRILGPDNAKLDEDVLDDDVPMLSFTATRSGPHLLAVMMQKCKVELCYFGFRVFGKP